MVPSSAPTLYEHDTTELIIPFHSESTAHSKNINISYYKEISIIGENPLIIDLAFWLKFSPFCNVLKSLNNSYQ